jgi:uncharacterized protein HemX
MPDELREDTVPVVPPRRRATLSPREKWFAAALLVLVVITGAGNLWSSYLQNRHFQQQFVQAQQQAAAAQRAQGAIVEAKLCSIFLPIADLKAPAGDGSSNPSRLFEQQLEAKLAQIAPALGCP